MAINNILVQKHTLRLDTSRYTITDIMNEINECVEILTHLGYDMSRNTYSVIWNTRAYTRLGQCKLKSVNMGKRCFELSFNKRYFETANPTNIHNTIMHEVCHSVMGCMNHQAPWRAVVNKVNARFGYNISRTSNDPNYREEVLEHRRESRTSYNFYCSCCKRVVCTYQRKSKAVVGVMTNPERWRCGRCGSWGTLSIQP